MLLARLAMLALMVVSDAGDDDKRRFHGDQSLLASALAKAQDCTEEANIWVRKQAAVVVVLYPRGDGLCGSDFPNHDAVGPAAVFQTSMPSETPFEKELRKSTVTLVFRREDGKTCRVNALSGGRLYDQNLDAQDVTAEEILCQALDEKVQLREFSAEDIKEIKKYLATPPTPCRHAAKKAASSPDAGSGNEKSQ
jgi:hypothetical protein